MKRLISDNGRELSVIVAIVLMFIIFGLMEPIYLSLANVRDIVEQAVIYGLMGIGMTCIIITGGIDLSVGSVLSMLGVIVALMGVSGIHPLLIIIIGLLVGFGAGALNGTLVAKLNLQPFIATMGTMSVFRGLGYVISNGFPVTGVPESYRMFINSPIGDLFRMPVIIFIVFAIIVHIVMKKTKLGIAAYAVGGNEEAARLSGVQVSKTKVLIYALGMLGTALAAMVQIGRLGVGDPTTGQGYELDAIASAAIGGTSMAGGRGTVYGTVFGAVLFAGLRVGLIVVGIDTFYQYIATGLVIIAASYIEVLNTKYSNKSKTKKNTQRANADA